MPAKYAVVKVDELQPNPWNPNRQTDFMYERERQSIREFGFIDPITVRSANEHGPLLHLQIVDGEHRWKAAKAEKIEKVPIMDLGVVPDARAKILTDLLNNLRGKSDPKLWADMIQSALDVDASLATLLPYSEQDITAMLASAAPVVDDNRKVRLYKRMTFALTHEQHARAKQALKRLRLSTSCESDGDVLMSLLDSAES